MADSGGNDGQLDAQQRQYSLLGLVLGVTLAAILCGAMLGVHDSQLLRESVAPAIKSLLAPLDAFLNSLPMWAAQASAIGLFVFAGIFAWCMPRRFIYLGAPDQALWRDLRIWATLVLVPYVLIYFFLGR